MAVKKIIGHAAVRMFGNSPYGNASSMAYKVKTNAVGAVMDTDDLITPLAIADVIDIGPLIEGMRLDDALVVVETGMTAGVTGSIGFRYEDGVDSDEFPQDAAYFMAGANLATPARLRANGTKLVTLPKPARLILTIAGAANAKASEITIIVTGEQVGPR